MIPRFDIEGGLPLAGARFISVAGLVAAAGSLFYARVLRPPGLTQTMQRQQQRLGLASLAAALAGALVWLVAQTQDMAGDVRPATIWSVMSATVFGHLLAGRLVLLSCAAAALAWRRGGLAAALALAALLLQAGHSHAVAMGGSAWLLGSAALHLLAAGIWLGGLPALWLVLAGATPALAWRAARRFSVAGIACVAVLLATATLQFDQLVMGLPGLVGTAYGWVIGLKIVLFAGLIALAARNRARLTPALPDGQAGVGRLRSAILLEIALGLAVLAAAGVLSELQPAMHMQKLWPFGWLPSLDAAREDPDILHEVAWAGAALALSLCLLGGAAILARRRRWLAAATAGAAIAIAAAALPHLSPLVVPAVPTAFYRSPTSFAAASIVRGAGLFAANCTACHGAGGHGDGPAAHSLPIPPADLTAPHLWMHSDGEMFWWLSHGIAGPDGRLAMPGFAALSDDERWNLIDYVRAHNAGLTLGAAGTWSTQVQAPDLALACPGAATTLSALRGAPVVLLLSAQPDAAPLQGATTVSLAAATPPPVCRATTQEAANAYSIVAPGAGAVLIDAHGWLRQASAAQAGLRASLKPVSAAPLPAERPSMDMDMDMDPNMKM